MTTKLSLEEKIRQTGGKRSYVQRLFGRIARIYDPMNRLMSLGLDQHWRAFAARYLALGTGELGLDLGTGTADLSIAVIRCSGPGTRMIGMDITPEMLEEQFYYKVTIHEMRGGAYENSLIEAAKSIAVQPGTEMADLRWGVIFYGVDDGRVGALYFDR